MGEEGRGPLFETTVGKGRTWYKLYALSVFIGLSLIWLYRASNIPEVGQKGRWVWLGMFAAELCFGFYWVLTQSFRWRPVFHKAFKDRLSQRYNVEPRSAAAYFSSPDLHGHSYANELHYIKELYNEMEDRIRNAIEMGHVPSNIVKQHKGFSEWNMQIEPGNHQPIVQILIDGRDQNATDAEGNTLPTLVYLSREKRPHCPHNFKAGALNALIRVSYEISNSPVILNVDCDMYSNSAESVRNAMCFFLDEERGYKIGHVQFPQNFNNLDRNNIYGDYISVVNEVELPGLGDCMYLGTGCFHRRESLCGRKYKEDFRMLNDMWNPGKMRNAEESTSIIEERAKDLASCTYEQNTGWGINIGIKYGCLVEDIVTGLSIQMNGWKSIYFNPPRKGFIGIAPTTLAQILVQHKRWSEGLFQTFLSRYCPFVFGYRKIELRLQMAYATYMLWSPMSLPTLYYVTVPSLCLLKGIPLFPRISSTWFLVFAYVILATLAYSLGEALWSLQSPRSWWNMKRTWLMRRTCSYFFSLIDGILQILGVGSSSFNITAKVGDQEAIERLKQGFMEFGSSSLMFSVLAATAMANLLCLVASVVIVVIRKEFMTTEQKALQFVLCGLLVMLNLPLYEGMFIRRDRGRLPVYLAFESSVFASILCLLSLY